MAKTIVQKVTDFTGRVFGIVTVLSFVRKDGNNPIWLCRCECGKLFERCIYWFTRKDRPIRDCGCQYVKKRGGHGLTGTPTYHAWEAIIQRCLNPKCVGYEIYGAKGITVCERWLTFANFLADMGERPSPKHQIDRFPKQDGGYEPGNCRWATLTEQHRNKKSNHLLTFNGKTQCVSAWAEETGLSRNMIYQRLARGWPVEQALTRPWSRIYGAPSG